MLLTWKSKYPLSYIQYSGSSCPRTDFLCSDSRATFCSWMARHLCRITKHRDPAGGGPGPPLIPGLRPLIAACHMSPDLQNKNNIFLSENNKLFFITNNTYAISSVMLIINNNIGNLVLGNCPLVGYLLQLKERNSIQHWGWNAGLQFYVLEL